MRKAILSRCISFALALLLAASLLLAGLCVYAEKTVADPENVLKALQAGDYIPTLRQEILDKWDNLLSVCGVSDTAPMLAVLTQEQLLQDAQAYFRGAYQGQQDIPTEPLAQALEAEVWRYVASLEEADPEDPELKANIQELLESCMEEYRISIRVPLLHSVLGKVTRYRKWLWPALLASGVFSLLLLVFLFFLQRKRRETLYFLTVAAATDGVLITGLYLLAKAVRLTERLPLAKSALQGLAVLCVQDMLHKLLRLGIVYLAAALLLLAAYRLLTTLSLKN